MVKIEVPQPIKDAYNKGIESFNVVKTKINQLSQKSRDWVVNHVAMDIILNAIACIPFFFMFNNLFWIAGIPIGLIFPHQIKEIDKKIATIVKNNLLIILIGTPLMIKSMPALLVVLGVYCPARLAATIYLNSQMKEDKKRPIIDPSKEGQHPQIEVIVQ